MSTTLREPSPSPSNNGNGKLSKLRLGRKTKSANISSQSLAGSSADGDEPSRRRSVEGLVDRLSPVMRRSSDDKRRSIDLARLSKLVPNRMMKRKGSDVNNAADKQSDLLSTDPDAVGRLSSNTSDFSLDPESGGSSLLTEDEDEDDARG